MYLSSVPLWRKTICVMSVRYSLSSAASSCASSFSEMVVNPRTSLNITVISVLRGFTRSGFSSSRRITSGLRYCWNAPRTRRFSFSSTSARYTATKPTLATSVPGRNDEVQPPSVQKRVPHAEAERHEQQQAEQHRSRLRQRQPQSQRHAEEKNQQQIHGDLIRPAQQEMPVQNVVDHVGVDLDARIIDSAKRRRAQIADSRRGRAHQHNFSFERSRRKFVAARRRRSKRTDRWPRRLRS